MVMKILLLGATGFIGKNLSEAIKNDARYELFAPDRKELNLLDAGACSEYLKKAKAEYVIHSAVDINSAEASLRSFFNVLNQKSHFKHLIQIGSGAEYDRKVMNPSATEDDFGYSIPTETYGLTKYLISRELNEVGPGKVTNFRLFGIFGKYEDFNRRFISNNIVRIHCGGRVAINQDVVFDYVDVRDFSKFILNIIPRLPLEKVSYNFCTGQPLRLSTIAEIIRKKMDVDELVVIRNEGLGREYTGCPNTLFSETGEFNFRSLEDSIDDLICFYKNNLTEEQIKLFKVGMNA